MTAIATDGQALLAQIIATPEDDAPRLIYADWLDEHDGELTCEVCDGRGKFVPHFGHVMPVRCQGCNGTGNVSNNFSARARHIRRHIKYVVKPILSDYASDVIDGIKPEWYGPLRSNWRQAGIASDRAIGTVWHRGFIDEVRCTLGQWMEHGPAIAAAHPVTRVVATDFAPWQGGDLLPDPGERRIWNASRFIEPTSPGHGDVPLSVFQHLKKNLATDHRSYHTEEDALADLSRAMLAFARAAE